MNEIEELEAAHSAAYYAYLDANHAAYAARKALDYDIATVAYTTPAANDVAANTQLHQHDLDIAVAACDVARTRMFSAARAFDSAIDNEESIKDD